jgi:transposase-like protein
MRVTTDGHDAYPRAIHETLGPGVQHRCSRYKNNRIEQDHRAMKQRSYPLRGFGSFASAARFCAGFEEQRQYFRPVARSGEAVSLGDRRRVFQERWAAIRAALTAA